jgi:hypothetical protein
MHRTIIVAAGIGSLLAATLLSFSCAESTDGVTPATSPESGAAPQEGGASSSDAASVTAPDSSQMVTASAVLVNEIAADKEWVELVGTGATAIDVSGYQVADQEKDGGGPKLKDAVTFPKGTVLSPKSYLIVQGGGIDAGVGKACPDGGQSYCFNANFGISNKSGETLYLLDTNGGVVGSGIYPPTAAPSGSTWGRIPNGDPNGKFAITVPTPGAANQAQ